MRAFVYEYITGGGTFSSASGLTPCGSLLGEGAGMRRALLEDFLRIAGCEVETLQDVRVPYDAIPGLNVHLVAGPEEERQAFATCCLRADVALIVAPEIDGALLQRANWLAESTGKNARLIHLVCRPELIAVASNKHQTAISLSKVGIPVPEGGLLENAEGLFAWQEEVEAEAGSSMGFVLKPVDGAGSWHLRRWKIGEQLDPAVLRFPLRFERFCEGTPASISLITSEIVGIEPILLPPLEQILDPQDGTFLGGRWIEDAALVDRARRLAVNVAAAFPISNGFWGIDIVLGTAHDGSQDYVIEVNPRITSSYIGLRNWTDANLVQAMFDTANGKKPALIWSRPGLEFRLAGPA